MSAADKQNRVNSQTDDGFEQTSTFEEPDINIPVVRRLSRPPEIWELVQPVATGRPGITNSLTKRLPSSKSILILIVAFIVGMGGYIGIRSGKRIARTTTTPTERPGQVDLSKTANAASEESTQQSNVPTPVVGSSVDQATAFGEKSENPKRRASSRRSKPVEPVAQVSSGPAFSKSASSAEGSDVSLPSNQRTRPVANNTETAGASAVDAGSSRKPKTSLSPQLIDSPKPDAQRKSKVIQWP